MVPQLDEAMASAKSPASKGLKIVNALADPDGMHRQPVLGGDGDQDAAAGGAVELGHDEAGDAGALAEDVDLGERVLAGGGIEHQEHGVRRGRARPCASRE